MCLSNQVWRPLKIIYLEIVFSNKVKLQRNSCLPYQLVPIVCYMLVNLNEVYIKTRCPVATF